MPGTDPHDPGASPAPPDAARAVDGDRSRVVWRLVGVHGRVQGVGFRDACCDLATALGVAGWVRNRRDGTVEALLHGPAERVERLCAALARATPATRVDRLVVRDVDGPSGAAAVLGDAAAPSGTGFERRPTA